MLALKQIINNKKRDNNHGFSLSELMVSIAISGIVLAGAGITFSMGIKAYRSTTAHIDASSESSTSLFRVTRGMGDDSGLRAAIVPVTTSSDSSGWNITFRVPKGIAGTDTQINKLRYNSDLKTISFLNGTNDSWNVIGKNIIESSIVASKYNIRVMVRAKSVVGNKTTINEMTSTIAFRN